MFALIFGDIHGKWHEANIRLRKALRRYPQTTHIFHVGDLAYGWPGLKKWSPQTQGRPFYFCDGNHDNIPWLRENQDNIPDPLHYMDRGDYLDIGGRRILFFGGASSTDKDRRTHGLSWWPEEDITYPELYRVTEDLSLANSVNLVIAHDRPNFVELSKIRTYDIGKSNRIALEQVFHHCRPSFWAFGHYHIYEQGCTNGLQWVCIPELDYVGWDGGRFYYGTN